MNKKFIPCGFEFTVARKKDTPIDNNVFNEKDLPLSKKAKARREKQRKEDEAYGKKHLENRLKEEYGVIIDLPSYIPYEERPGYAEEKSKREEEEKKRWVDNGGVNPFKPNRSSISLRDNKKFRLSPFKWIRQNFHSDSCGAEIATPIVKKQQDVTRYYQELMMMVKKHNLTVNLEDAECGLGGCHIHMSLGQFDEIGKHFFIKNIAIFLTNYPELNWGFNDPNDNENANSLLMPVSNLIDTVDIGNHGIRYKYIKGEDGREIQKVTYRPGGKLYKFRKDNNIFRLMMANPLEASLVKQYSFRYNRGYNTLEFRLFDMPNTLKRHLLHHEVAISIFNLCAEFAKRQDTMELTRTDFIYNLESSKEKFLECMKTLGIHKNRVGVMLDNIETRYQWTEENRLVLGEEYNKEANKYKNFLL
jgi:hypothetical protein